MPSKIIKSGIFAMLAVFGFAACDSDSTSLQNGQISILLTDEPGDFHTAMVTISGIYLQGGSEDDAPRVWLMEEEVTTDLLTLANDILPLVEDMEVSAGNYSQLRLVISGGYIEVEQEDESTRIYATPGYAHVPSDRTVDGVLQMPSFAQSGLKVVLPNGGIQVTGTQTILLVDFNVAESFGQQAGASGMWVMTPVVHAVDFGLSSGVTVTLALGDDVELPEGIELADFGAHLYDESGNEKDAAFVFDEESDSYSATFSYLLPGESWELVITGPDGVSFETDPELPIEVETPSSGGGVQIGVTISAASSS